MDEIGARYRAMLEERGYSAATVRRRLQLYAWAGGTGMTAASCRAVIDRPPTPESRRQYHSGMKRVVAELREAGWLDGDPMAGWRLPPPSTYRPRPLAAHEVAQLMAVPGRVGEWTTVGYYGALRRHEVCALRPEQLVRADGHWFLEVVGKGHRTDTIPAHPAIVELLRGRPAGRRLWEVSPNHLTRTWNNVASAVLGARVTFHQLRHSGITACYERSGCDLITTARFARHRRIQTTLVYAEAADWRLLDAVAGL